VGHVVVRGELRREAVPGVCEPRPDGHEDSCGARGRAKRVRGERPGPEHAECDPEPGTARMVGLALGGRQREQGRPGRDRQHRDQLTAPHALAKMHVGDCEQHDEAGPEQRLDERERRVNERERLQRPASDPESGAREPAWACDQPPEQRKAHRALRGSDPRLRRLEHDSGGEEDGCAAAGEDPGQEPRHRR